MNKVLSNEKTIAIFILPAFLFCGVFVLIPIIYNIYLNTFQADLMGKKNFALFRNYMSLLGDKMFLETLENNRILVAGSLLAHLSLALLFGNSIFIKIKGSRFFQSILFLSSVICRAGVGFLFNIIYNSESDLLNTFLDLVRLSDLKHAWLSERKMVMPALITVMMWKYVGCHIVIQLTAVKSIPDNLLEAVRVDRVTTWQQLTETTYPLIEYMIKTDVVLIITGSLRYFDLVWTMAREEPNRASEVMATYVYYQRFRTMKLGYASAIGLTLLVLCMLVIWGANHLIWTEKLEY